MPGDDILDAFEAAPFGGYVYSYPHKTAHRPLTPAVPLDSLWAQQGRDALFLYLHVPFCPARCGFCNLFSLCSPPPGMIDDYLATLARQARVVRSALGACSFARLAVGGGTPTILDCRQLEALLAVADVMGADVPGVGGSVEISPRTVDLDKLRLLRQAGLRRVSVGIQAFDEAQARALGRVQSRRQMHEALEAVRGCGFETLNIDLIYGGPQQDMQDWCQCLHEALKYKPEELYVYPLYVRPQTALAGRSISPDLRLQAYRVARAMLLDAGYRQISARMFQLPRVADGDDGPAYCCQDDGMVGLGCGPRSYTRQLHYSGRYAVSRSGIEEILDRYIATEDRAFAWAAHGIWLDDEDQRRRFVLQSLLQCRGLDRGHYQTRFGSDAVDDLPQLAQLQSRGLALFSDDAIHLSERGIELSDAIGPWLYSAAVRRLMDEFQWQQT
ncbi:MAG: STM4012 family radical SAM protein [Planctomycetaceae bacterium]|nr:STM4012 family radical SAM protein [Planctomycetaceae bacterium]